jgi:hypothetical protein
MHSLWITVIATTVPGGALSGKTDLPMLDIGGTDDPAAASKKARQPGREPAGLRDKVRK